MPTKKKELAEAKEQPKKNQPSNKIETREIDAEGKVLGRLATEIAIVLLGKDKASFKRNMVSGDKVRVVNAAKIVITGRKMEQKKYYRHSGYLGHLKETSLKDLMLKDPADVVRRAVYGMLPNNKLKKDWLKNLIIQN